MSRVTSLTKMPDAQLNRWIKRIALLFVVLLVAFVALYAFDRFRLPTAEIVDTELAVLEEAVRADPADSVARGQLADLYYIKARYVDAIAQYTLLIDADKETYAASLGRARAYMKTEQPDLAIKDYEKVVEIGLTGEMANVDPVLAAGYYGLGTIALAQDRLDDAVEQLTKAEAIQRTDADVLFALATALIKTGEAEQAIEKLNLAVALVPIGWPEPYLALETAYKDLGKADQAEWAGAMGAFAAGDNTTARARLEAITDGDAALQATIGLGLVNEATGDTVAAAEWYQKAIVIDPDNSSATLGLSRVRQPAASPSGGSN